MYELGMDILWVLCSMIVLLKNYACDTNILYDSVSVIQNHLKTWDKFKQGNVVIS